MAWQHHVVNTAFLDRLVFVPFLLIVCLIVLHLYPYPNVLSCLYVRCIRLSHIDYLPVEHLWVSAATDSSVAKSAAAGELQRFAAGSSQDPDNEFGRFADGSLGSAATRTMALLVPSKKEKKRKHLGDVLREGDDPAASKRVVWSPGFE